MNISKKLVFLISLILVSFGCSKKEGVTTSKIKIVGGKAFANALSTKANNGLVLYGKSNDGKSFTKVIDSDTFEMVFPNGTWNFYTIAWQYATPSSATGLMGSVSCGKSLGVQLNGTDASISMTLDNANCDGAIHPDSDTVSGSKKLPSFNLYSCKDLSTISGPSNGSNCAKSNFNKGYATYVKVFIPEHRQFNQTGDGVTGGGIFSKCFEIDSTTNAAGLATSESSIASNLNLPLPGINGMVVGVRTYYSSSTCDDNFGFDNFYWKEGQVSTKLKRFTDHSGGAGTQAIEHYFVQTDPVDVCRPPRLAATAFASGRGTAFLPYGICTPEQLKLIKIDFNTGYITRDKSFDLLANLNFNFAEYQPIGDATDSNNAPVNDFSGNFNGNNFKIENIFINCKNLFAGTGQGIGLFRSSNNSTFSNLTINKIAFNCEPESSGFDNIGALVGASNYSYFKNIKVFGHISGRDNVGGIVGYYNGSTNGEFSDVHVEASLQGRQAIGGLIGFATNFASTPNKVMVYQSSFKGELHTKLKGTQSASTSVDPGATGYLGEYKQVTSSFTLAAGPNVVSGDYIYYNPTTSNWWKLNGNNSDIPYDSWVGGIIGFADSTQNAIISETKIDLNNLSASRMFGGFIGKSSNISIENSYVTGFMSNTHFLDGMVGNMGFARVGGVVGYMSNGSISNTIVQLQKNISTNTTTDTSIGGLMGENFGGVPSCNNNLYIGNQGVTTCNNAQGVGVYGMFNNVNYSTFSGIGSGGTIWNFPSVDYTYDIPRLTWEISRENQIPYLKRLCSGKYPDANRTGTGDSASLPKSVCTWSQLMNMVPGKYYTLLKSLIHDGTLLSTASLPDKIPAGVYRLNGNNFTLSGYYNMPTANQNGFFEDLQSGSEVANLKLKFFTLATSGQNFSTGTIRSGILAGSNNGIIRNIEIDHSKINYINPTLSGTAALYAGGLVGLNNTNGTLTEIENRGKVSILQPTVTGGSSYLKVGGIAGMNSGTLSIIRHDGYVERLLGNYGGNSIPLAGTTCIAAEAESYVYNTNTSPLPIGNYYCPPGGGNWQNIDNKLMTNTEYWGGLVAINDGLIEQIEFDGELKINDYTTNSNGTISPLIALFNSNSTIKDLYFRGRLNNVHSNITTIWGGGFFGSILRAIFSMDSMNNGTNLTSTNAIIPSSGATQAICIKGSGMVDCHNNPMSYDHSTNGLTFKESGTPISGFQDLTGWNVGIGFVPDMTKTWNLESATNSQGEPSLMRTGGDFAKIGTGF